MNELLLALPDAVIAADAAGRVVFVNRAAEALFGATAETLVGSPLDALVPRLGRTTEIDRLRVRRPDGLEIEVDAALAVSDGKRVLTLRHAAPSVEPDERYRAVFESAPIGILHFDARGVITACNERALAILGSPRSLLVGLALETLP